MRKKTKQYPIKLDLDEEDLLESVERGEWGTIDNIKEEKKKASKLAARSLQKKSDMGKGTGT